MTTANPYAGERLDHPAITRELDGKAIRYHLAGDIDREAMTVLHRLICIDLLAARGDRSRTDRDLGKRQAFVIDLAAEPNLDAETLKALEHHTELIQREMGSLVFENVSPDLFALLKAARFTNCFTARRTP